MNTINRTHKPNQKTFETINLGDRVVNFVYADTEEYYLLGTVLDVSDTSYVISFHTTVCLAKAHVHSPLVKTILKNGVQEDGSVVNSTQIYKSKKEFTPIKKVWVEWNDEYFNKPTINIELAVAELDFKYKQLKEEEGKTLLLAEDKGIVSYGVYSAWDSIPDITLGYYEIPLANGDSFLAGRHSWFSSRATEVAIPMDTDALEGCYLYSKPVDCGVYAQSESDFPCTYAITIEFARDVLAPLLLEQGIYLVFAYRTNNPQRELVIVPSLEQGAIVLPEGALEKGELLQKNYTVVAL